MEPFVNQLRLEAWPHLLTAPPILKKKKKKKPERRYQQHEPTCVYIGH